MRLGFLRSTVLAAALTVLGSAPSIAQPLTYRLAPVEGSAPSPRLDGTIAYEPGARTIFLFGGSDNSGAKNDVWSYSLDQGRWTQIAASGTPPPARWGHTTTFDPVRRRLIVFGGQSSGFFSDTWAFDIASSTWQQLAGEGAGPSKRYSHSGIYDVSRDRLVVSHGFTDAGRFDDTWAFDLRTNSWQNITPAAPRPVRRCLHHAVYDGGDRMFLYGGCASGFGPCPLGDLWSFDLRTNRWTEIRNTVQPRARTHYGMSFDTGRSRLVLYGGSGGGNLDDTWEFDPAATTWRQPSLSSPSPGARNRHQGIYAADLATSFFFGGSTNSGLSNQLWALASTAATPAPSLSSAGVVNAFSNSPGEVAPGEIVSIFGTTLGPNQGVAGGLDPTTGRLAVNAAGVSVTFNQVPAPLFFAQASQLNVQVPYEVAGSAETRIVVTVDGVSSPATTVPVRETHPGLFPRAFHADFRPVSAEAPAMPGELIILFATGQGVTNPASRTGALASSPFPDPVAPVTLMFGGRLAEVVFRGQAPDSVGLMQINARVPAGVSGDAPLILQIGSAMSQPGLTIPVR